MKKFIKDNLCLVIVGSVVVVVVLILSVWGITKLVSSDDKKFDNNQNNTETNQNNNNTSKEETGKYDSINDAKDLVNSSTIEKLYNYVSGFGYKNVGDGKTVISSEIYQNEKVTLSDLTQEAILRTAINQIVVCNGNCNKHDTIKISDVESKLVEIFGNVPSKVQLDKNINVVMNDGLDKKEYVLNGDEFVNTESSYCSTLPLDNGYKLVSVVASSDDSNILYLYDENEEGLMYRHAFKKNDNGYRWFYSEPLGK